MKMSVIEKKMITNRKSHPAIDNEVCKEIMNCLRSKLILKCRHIMNKDEKKTYWVLKKGIYEFVHINHPVYGWEKDCFATTDEENPKIVPRVRYYREIGKIVSFFYHAYKGKGVVKIQSRIKRFHIDISIKRIQKWLSSNENNFKIHPIFSNNHHCLH